MLIRRRVDSTMLSKSCNINLTSELVSALRGVYSDLLSSV